MTLTEIEDAVRVQIRACEMVEGGVASKDVIIGLERLKEQLKSFQMNMLREKDCCFVF